MALASGAGIIVGLLPRGGAARAFAAGESGIEGLGMLVVLGLIPLAVAGLFDMRRSAEWFIARRYLVAKRRQVFISAITGICVVGIAAGVWLLIVVLSVMNGFEQTWREEILGNRAHFVVQNGTGSFGDYEAVVERVRAVPGVVAASPYVDADAMVRGRSGEIFSVRLRGVDPAHVGEVTRLDDDLLSGSLDALDPARAAADDPVEDGDDAPGPVSPPMLVGHQLASSLGIGVGDDLLLISPFGGPPTPLGPGPGSRASASPASSSRASTNTTRSTPT